jgi:hypothetical protein
MAHTFVLDDSAEGPASHQLRKSEFLSQLRVSITRTVEDAVLGTGRSALDCPYIEFWFGYYSTQSVQRINRAIRKYAPESLNATSAAEVIMAISQHAWQAARTWATTGRITGLPQDLPSAMAAAEKLKLSPGAARRGDQLDRRDGAQGHSDEPATIKAGLGRGEPFAGDARTRMEGAFGRDFSGVRIHTDLGAAEASNDRDARAFTVGQDVAFGRNEYQPGSPLGDALLAHELAHVIQQQDARDDLSESEGGASSALEEDADTAAMGALTHLWSGVKETTADISRNAVPRLKTGLRLSRCHKDAPAARGGAPAAAAGQTTVTIAEVNLHNTEATVKRIPPRVDTPVAVTVAGPTNPPVTLSIDGSGGDNGSATINGAATHDLTGSETVNLRGVDQTAADLTGLGMSNAGRLKLVAKQGTNQLAESNGFSVAAYPISIGFTFQGIFQNAQPVGVTAGAFWGASYDLSFESDSHVGTDCGYTTISENLVDAGSTGLFAGTQTIQSGFFPTTNQQRDSHAHGVAGNPGPAALAAMRAAVDNHATDNSTSIQHQFFRFSCARSGIAENRNSGPKVPASGFKITRTASVAGGHRLIHVKKEGFANNGVSAGTVNDTTVKDVEV